jgi:hypothetical protein
MSDGTDEAILVGRVRVAAKDGTSKPGALGHETPVTLGGAVPVIAGLEVGQASVCTHADAVAEIGRAGIAVIGTARPCRHVDPSHLGDARLASLALGLRVLRPVEVADIADEAGSRVGIERMRALAGFALVERTGECVAEARRPVS